MAAEESEPAKRGGLHGKLVEVSGSSDNVEARDCLLNLIGETIDPNGQRGQAFWDEESGEYTIATLDGIVISVPEADVQESFDPGFDIQWPSFSSSARARPTLALRVAQVLDRRGFCVIKMPDGGPANALSRMASERTDYVRPKTEFEEAYLGLESTSMVAWLDEVGEDADEPLTYYGKQLTDIGYMLMPVSEELLGFRAWHRRCGSMLRMPARDWGHMKAAPIDGADVQDGVVENYLDFVRRRKLCVMYLVDSCSGFVELLPRDPDSQEPTVELPVSSNRVLIFRHDWLNYRCRDLQGTVLQSWFMEEPQHFRLDQLDCGQGGFEAILGCGPNMAPELQVHIMAGNCRFPGNASRIEGDWQVYSMMVDAFKMIDRWDMSMYYAEETDQFNMSGKSVTRHAGHLNDSELAAFDNSFFGFTENEAGTLPAILRVLLEVNYECLSLVGYDLNSLAGAPILSSVADIGLEWDAFQGMGDQDWLRCGSTVKTSGNRISHALGLTGPTWTCDTACSASLVGSNMCHASLKTRKYANVDTAISSGVMCNMFPWPFIGLSGAGMLGAVGRCMTFNSSGNGFNRGEGSGALLLKISDDARVVADRLACYQSSFINQDGRSASLTAPNGPSQQACMRSSWREINLSPQEVSVTENHGTGTALGDPIECGSCKAVFRSKATGVGGVNVGAGKTHMGHLEAVAGLNGLLKILTSLVHAVAPANNHLRTLNAHIETSGWPALFTTESCDLGAQHHHGGANGFGFGGTNARADFWSRRLHRIKDQGARVLDGEFFFLDKTKDAKPPEFLERLDCFTVSCPRCLGPMCWLCSEAFPDYYSEGGAAPRKHRCSMVRPEAASYRWCSDCYQGPYELEDLDDYNAARDIASGPPVEGLYIAGTFSAWKTLEPMSVTEVGNDGTVYYAGEFSLGDVRVEQFHLVWQNIDGKKLVLHPVAKKAGRRVKIAGPEEDARGMHWLVDGRRDEAVEGTVYEVRFEWGPRRKHISWCATDRVTPVKSLFVHEYWMVDSLSGWLHSRSGNPRPGFMTWEVGKPGLPPPFIPASGQVEFFILRDNDTAQTIYPMTHRPKEQDVLVLGPDEGGDGKRFLAIGEEGEPLQTYLDLKDGKMSVQIITITMGKFVLESAPGDAAQVYYVTRAGKKWGFERMASDSQGDPDIWTYQFQLSSQGVEDFQIVVNANVNLRIYPSSPRAEPGSCLVNGPDRKGKDKSWHVIGDPFQWHEIRLDLSDQEDFRSMVSCMPVDDALFALEPAS